MSSTQTSDRLQEGRPLGASMDDLDKGDNYTVRDLGLAENGALLVDWARARMPVLAKLKRKKLSKPNHSQECVLPVAFT